MKHEAAEDNRSGLRVAATMAFRSVGTQSELDIQNTTGRAVVRRRIAHRKSAARAAASPPGRGALRKSQQPKRELAKLSAQVRAVAEKHSGTPLDRTVSQSVTTLTEIARTFTKLELRDNNKFAAKSRRITNVTRNAT
jgi:hypothetical protein